MSNIGTAEIFLQKYNIIWADRIMTHADNGPSLLKNHHIIQNSIKRFLLWKRYSLFPSASIVHFYALHSLVVTCHSTDNTRPLTHSWSMPTPPQHSYNSILHCPVFCPVLPHGAWNLSVVALGQVSAHSLLRFQFLNTLPCPFQRQIWFIDQDCDASKGPELVSADQCQILSYRKALAPHRAHHDFLQYFLSPLPFRERYPMFLSARSSSSHIELNICVSEAHGAFRASCGRLLWRNRSTASRRIWN